VRKTRERINVRQQDLEDEERDERRRDDVAKCAWVTRETMRIRRLCRTWIAGFSVLRELQCSRHSRVGTPRPRMTGAERTLRGCTGDISMEMSYEPRSM